ncbi:aminoglycoside phosphotransferase family protein [Marinicella litoralis]|uniref:Aminoglycoside phosphotransferase domain-containing protein n=1 Tax=Marinicella litoralis TaxID=644220 RepID=A0A4V3DHJ9_9GAMM|nr:phosphotransferase [Marinicella litoralis]TDR18501.1 hypothetical protein C8D91_2421 [Marinicella litoralis]
MSSRNDELIQWLIEIIETKQFTLNPASEDASFRSYFRLKVKSENSHKSFIVMDAPPEHEDCAPFIHVQKLLFSQQINVPEIFAFNPDKGFMLLSDFGSTLLLDELAENTADELYRKAINELIALQAVDDKGTLPLYDAKSLLTEMELFTDWFIGKHLAHELSQSQQKVLKQTHALLIDNATSQPQVLVHRDFHSRNIMLTDNQPGIIDFQDAVVGPITYDLASLLKDCYVSWPSESVNQWVKYYLTQYQQKHQINHSFDQFIRWFDLMAAQRHLKAIGIFCRLYYRDGKKQFLYDIPRTMKYLITTCDKYHELADFGVLLAELQPSIINNP